MSDLAYPAWVDQQGQRVDKSSAKRYTSRPGLPQHRLLCPPYIHSPSCACPILRAYTQFIPKPLLLKDGRLVHAKYRAASFSSLHQKDSRPALLGKGNKRRTDSPGNLAISIQIRHDTLSHGLSACSSNAPSPSVPPKRQSQ